MSKHIPVLKDQVIDSLRIKPDGNYADGTLGFAGHTEAILARLNASARLVATDVDPKAFRYCQDLFSNDTRVRLFNTNFTNLDVVAALSGIQKFDGILADLGVSSAQFDDPEYGFTYRTDTVLDLRLDRFQGEPFSKKLSVMSEKEIADIIFKYGEERQSFRIAREILKIDSRPYTTGSIKEAVAAIIPGFKVNDTLSKVFQAFRIFTNNELENLKIFLRKSLSLLAPGGRLAVITFHSLEDRIVKEFFRHENLDCVCPQGTPVCICGKERTLKIITKKPLTASKDEISINNRSRSAKLRVAERI